jgi:signal transduction histidine kinase
MRGTKSVRWSPKALSYRALQHRFRWRFRARLSPGEIRRTERWLASARVFLAISALVAIWIDPGAIRYSPWTYWLLGVYIVHGVVIMLLLRWRQQSTPAFRLLVHAADIVWPALMAFFTAWQGNPFFLFFVFVLAAAAYRWGLWETLGTAASAVALLWIGMLALHFGFTRWLGGLLFHQRLLFVRGELADFEPKNLFMRAVYLGVLALLLGYLAEQQKQLRAEKAVIARVLGKARVEAGLTATLQEITGELLSMYGAKQLLIASQEGSNHRAFVGGMRCVDGVMSPFRWIDSVASDRETYLYGSNVEACQAWRAGSAEKKAIVLVGLDASGDRVRATDSSNLLRLAGQHEFEKLVTVNFVFGREWSGRIFLFDPILTAEVEEELRFLQELIKQVGPAVYNVYLLRRLRQRAGAVERARFARELHDGAVQSLIAVEMQVDVLRRQSVNDASIVTEELGRIQGLLREEVLKLRELMQQMKSLDVDSTNLIGFFADTVERFQRETGISAHFVSGVEDLDLPRPTCRELAHIVQEALINVRKHSRAQHVLVRFSSEVEKWELVIEDDGSGFPFSGRIRQAELEALGKGPLVIKERVRLIQGELTIESNPGRGSRIEISVPQLRELTYGQ